MKWWLGRVVVFVCVGWILVTSAIAQDWQSPYGHNHVLIGKIWDSRAKAWISDEQWLQKLTHSKIVLLGETHSNEDHHRLQAQVLDAFHERQQRPALVFEMFPFDVDSQRLNDWTTLKELKNKVELFGPRWPWSRYQSLLEAVFKNRQNMIGADLNQAEMTVVSEQSGAELVRAGEYWAVENALNATQRWQLGDVIKQAHCGYVSQQRLPRSINIQIARDLSFALTLAQSLEDQQIPIMIVGAGHVRKDFGIPSHLRRMGLSSVSVLFAPVQDGLTSVADYTLDTDARIYDFIYFTANSHRDDPCVEFAKQLKQLKNKEKQTHAR